MHENVTLLQTQLRQMIEDDRTKIVDYYAKWFKGAVQRFLEARKPNLTVYDVYKAPYVPPIGYAEATDYNEVCYHNGVFRFAGNKANREPFDVNFKPNADEILYDLAVKEVEQMVQMFLTRATDKLGPFVERKSGIKMKKVNQYTGFADGAWVGNIEFRFDDGTVFYSTLKVITNQSKYGRLFGQYPMTFHEVKLMIDGELKECGAMAPIETLWASVGYVPPPPQPKPRWNKIVGGSVVIHEGKRVFIATPGVAKKLGILDGAEQIARIEAGETQCRVEHANGSIDRFKYPKDQFDAWRQMEKDTGNYNRVSALRREFAYGHFFPEE